MPQCARDGGKVKQAKSEAGFIIARPLQMRRFCRAGS
jgi:hypothetical protein